MFPSLDAIPHLSATRWDLAQTKAKDLVKRSLIEPKYGNYKEDIPSAITPVVRWGLIVALLLVAVAAFWISAGKQITVSSMLFDPFQGQEHLSSGWSDGAIIASLGFTEIGTILFSVFASAFAGPPVQINGRTVHTIGAAFRGFSILCATTAILANVTITAMHNNAGFDAMAWFITFAAPTVVIGIGLAIERMVMQGRSEQAESEAKYQKDKREYEMYCVHPEFHGTYKATWVRCLYEEITQSKAVKLIAEGLIEQYGPGIRGEIVKREIGVHDYWATLELTVINPTTPLQAAAGEDNNSSKPLSLPQSS